MLLHFFMNRWQSTPIHRGCPGYLNHLEAAKEAYSVNLSDWGDGSEYEQLASLTNHTMPQSVHTTFLGTAIVMGKSVRGGETLTNHKRNLQAYPMTLIIQENLIQKLPAVSDDILHVKSW